MVGVGAWAGGLDAFMALLANLPARSGMAFLFIQHLDPKRASILPEILAPSSPMPVRHAQQGMVLEPNHVYVGPPNAIVTVADGRIQVTPRPEIPPVHARGLHAAFAGFDAGPARSEWFSREEAPMAPSECRAIEIDGITLVSRIDRRTSGVPARRHPDGLCGLCTGSGRDRSELFELELTRMSVPPLSREPAS